MKQLKKMRNKAKKVLCKLNNFLYNYQLIIIFNSGEVIYFFFFLVKILRM